MIDEERATDMATYFLSKRRSGEMHYKKLMGLMYLAERRTMERYCNTICEDYFEAKGHGPVLSETYKLMEGTRISSVDVWDEDKEEEFPFDIWGSKINKLDDGYISVKELLTVDDLSKFRLSERSIDMLDEIWEEFGKLNEQQLIDYIKKNCPEWEQTVRGEGRMYEGKESFPNEITTDTVGEQLGMTKSGINRVKSILNPWEWEDTDKPETIDNDR